VAFRTRRRRRPLVQWLPVFGDGGNETNEAAIGIRTTIALSGNPADTRVDAVGLTFDYTDSAETAQAAGDDNRTLRDLVSGSAYRLRRIVGKVFAHCYRASDDDYADSPPLVDYASGFIVCRTDSFGNATTDFTRVNPLQQDGIGDPWIWRRRWILGTSGPAGTLTTYAAMDSTLAGATAFPRSNIWYGSVQDGPHIDVKTARVINQEERLYWVNAARGLGYAFGNSGAQDNTVFLQGLLDSRALASLKFGAGNRRNASR